MKYACIQFIFSVCQPFTFITGKQLIQYANFENKIIPPPPPPPPIIIIIIIFSHTIQILTRTVQKLE